MTRFERWRALIVAARDADSVRRTALDCLSCITPAESQGLPAEFRQAMASCADDLQGAAVLLLREELRYGGGDAAELMREVSELVTAASVRLMQVERMRQGSPIEFAWSARSRETVD